MLIEEKRKVEKIETKPIKRICDICQKEIDCNNWFTITTSHHDWGNDSCESLETKDACSSKCVLKFASEYIEEAEKNKFNTRDIKIEHRRSIYAY